MKKNIFLFALLPFLLSSCSLNFFNRNLKQDDTPQEGLEQEEEPEGIKYEDLYELSYNGPAVTVLKYGDTYQISGLLFNGEPRTDVKVGYRISKTYLTDDLSISNTGLITTPKSPCNENHNEYFEVTISSGYVKNQVTLRFAIVQMEENVSFDTILNGKDYYFYTSTGIVENLKVNMYDEETYWYAECVLHEEGTNESFATTISKSYDYVGLESNIVTSHFKTVIKRDERGGATAKDIKNGTKVKFMTMYEHNDEYGYTRQFNSIVMEELSTDDSFCDITCYDSSIQVSKTSGHFDETFTITRPSDKFYYVVGDYGMTFAEEYLTEDQTQAVYKISSKHMRIYSQENISALAESPYLACPAGTYSGPMGFENKADLNNYLFGDNTSIYVRHFTHISQRTNGFAIGSDGSSSCAHISIAIPRNLNIIRITCHVEALSSSRPAIFHYSDNYEVGGGATWLEKVIEKGDPGFDFSMPVSSWHLINPLREITMWVNPRSEHGSFKSTTGVVITNLTFYTRDQIVTVI